MFKVVIVDDEQALREGMKTIIDWQTCGFEVVGDAEDAAAGITEIDRLCPDVVLVDVRMPEMTGIEMIEKILTQEKKPPKFIILSGYGDFEYTKKAILLGVDAYLLKPVDEEELIKTLSMVKEKIEQEDVLKGYFEEGRQSTRHNLLKLTLESGYGRADWFGELAELEATAGKPGYAVAMLWVRRTGGVRPELANQEILRVLHKRNIYAYESQEIVALLPYLRPNEAKRRMEGLLALIKSHCGAKVFVSMGAVVNSLAEVHQSYRQAKELMLNRFFFSHKELVWVGELSTGQGKSLHPRNMVDTLAERVVLAVQLADREALAVGLHQLEQVFYERIYSENETKSICSNLLVDLLGRITVQKEETPAPHREDVLLRVYSAGNLQELMEYMGRQLDELTHVLKDVTADTVIQRVAFYVQNNYRNRLTLDMLGVMFGYNSVYLGRTFKQKMGQSFNDFLETLRLEEAKNLLHKEGKIYTIAEQVGFRNKDYFCTQFRKNVGMTPKEYRSQIKKNGT